MTILSRFMKSSNGRGSLLELKSAFAGKAVWEKIIKNSYNFLENCKYTGTAVITL